MPAHKDLTGTNLHEPKGAAAASADTVYVANGSGSGVWEKVTLDSIDTSTIKNTNKESLTYSFTDIGTAGSTFYPVTRTCSITTIYVTIDLVTATAATVITFRNDAGNSMGTISIPSATAAGTVFSLTPISNNTFTAGQKFQIETDGGTSTATRMNVVSNIAWT